MEFDSNIIGFFQRSLETMLLPWMLDLKILQKSLMQNTIENWIDGRLLSKY